MTNNMARSKAALILKLFSIVDRAARQNLLKNLYFVTILNVFHLSTHKTLNCLCTADFNCVHGTQRSEFFMRTERKIVRTYAVRIVIYSAE